MSKLSSQLERLNFGLLSLLQHCLHSSLSTTMPCARHSSAPFRSRGLRSLLPFSSNGRASGIRSRRLKPLWVQQRNSASMGKILTFRDQGGGARRAPGLWRVRRRRALRLRGRPCSMRLFKGLILCILLIDRARFRFQGLGATEMVPFTIARDMKIVLWVQRILKGR